MGILRYNSLDIVFYKLVEFENHDGKILRWHSGRLLSILVRKGLE